MNIDIPPIDPFTFWSGLVTIVTAPVIWVYRKFKDLETNFVTKEEFDTRLDELESSSRTGFQLIRNDISRLEKDRKSTRLNSSHIPLSRMPSSA